MDGNGRWAKARHRPRSFGHRAGVEAVRRLVEDASDLKIRHLTLYSFSTENWTRPKAEVTALMRLMQEYIEGDLARLHEEGVRIRIIGRRDGLSQDLLSRITQAETKTANNSRFFLNIAFNYGGRDEVLRAMKRAVSSVSDLSALDENAFGAFLDTRDIPDPDLVIRTSGEKRISNFLLWQAAYAELVFTDVLWPDFGRQDLIDALKEYGRRHRRFGASDTSEVA